MILPGFREGKLLRVFVDEADRTGPEPTYCAIVDFLRKRGVSGATVFRGIEGYGSHNQVHLARVFAWRQNMPILIEVVDDWEKLEPLIPELKALMREGLMTVEVAEYLRLSRASNA
jgi:hypothetical protein